MTPMTPFGMWCSLAVTRPGSAVRRLLGLGAGGGRGGGGRARGARGQAGVVPRRDGLVHDLLERPHSGLAVLGLDEVEQLVLLLEDEIVVAQEHGGALADRRGRPALLHSTALGHRCGDILGGSD